MRRVGLALVAVAVVAAGSTPAVGIPHGQQAHGLHLLGPHAKLPKKVQRGSFVADGHDTYHVVATRETTDASGNAVKTLTYLTRKPGTKRWLRHDVANGPAVQGSDQIFAKLTTTRRKLLTVVTNCASSAIYTSVTPIAAKRLAAPTSAYPQGAPFKCRKSEGQRGAFIGAVALPHDGAMVLFDQTRAVDSGSEDAFHNVEVAVGPAGNTFAAPQALPNPDDLLLRATGIARDRRTGEVTVIGEHLGDGADDRVVAWTKPAHGSWSDPKTLLHGTYSSYNVTAANGQVTVGITMSDGRPGTVIRGHSGHWSKPTAIPHTSRNDMELIVEHRRSGHGLVALFLRFRPGSNHNSGLYTESFSRGKWRGGHYLVRGTFLITPTEISFVKSGKLVFGYLGV